MSEKTCRHLSVRVYATGEFNCTTCGASVEASPDVSVDDHNPFEHAQIYFFTQGER